MDALGALGYAGMALGTREERVRGALGALGARQACVARVTMPKRTFHDWLLNEGRRLINKTHYLDVDQAARTPHYMSSRGKPVCPPQIWC